MGRAIRQPQIGTGEQAHQEAIMERIVGLVTGQLLRLWNSSTPIDYLWLGMGILVVGWIVSKGSQPRYR